MGDLFSGLFASIAGLFSGAESKFCPILLWSDVECPKELL